MFHYKKSVAWYTIAELAVQSKGTQLYSKYSFCPQLTGLCVVCEGVRLGLAAPSKPSACVLISRVVKRLDSMPRTWMIDCLLVGLGCKDRQRRYMSDIVMTSAFEEKTLPNVRARRKINSYCICGVNVRGKSEGNKESHSYLVIVCF